MEKLVVDNIGKTWGWVAKLIGLRKHHVFTKQSQIMYSLFTDINDAFPKCVAETFQECVVEAKKLLSQNAFLDGGFIFRKESLPLSLPLKKEFAGMVTRKEAIEFRTTKAIHFEIVYKTVFDHHNSAFCFGPSIYFYCQKLKDYNNKIVSIKPVTMIEFYKKMDKPLPFGSD